MRKQSLFSLLLSTLFNLTDKRIDKHVHQLHSKTPPPSNDDRDGWRDYWRIRGQMWRTEPEIDKDRQKYLAERRNIKPDIENGIYPFKDIKLDRADVEWLLATHEIEYGPVVHMIGGHARGLDLRGADLRSVDLSRLPLTQLRGGLGHGDWLGRSKEQREAAAIHLGGANLDSTDLTWSALRFAHLEGTILSFAYLGGATLRAAHLEGADLRSAHLDSATNFQDVILGNKKYGFVLLADTHWNGSNLVVMDWASVPILGDEQQAHQRKTTSGKMKTRATRIDEYQAAVRANRQLAVALQTQGLNEDAARFAYRAQLMQRRVFWYQRNFGQYLFSLFLALLTGYGYKPIRSFITYAVVISIFAFIYFLLGPHLRWNEAIVISMTAFHGRGFFPEQFKPGDPQALVAAIEAFVGLLIEVTFIATLTQRLFGK